MRDGEWLLGYSSHDEYPGANLTFGMEASGIYCLSEPDVTFADIDTADASLPGEDGVRMGRDYQRSATVTFELGVDGARTLIDRHYPRRPWAHGPLIGDWSEFEGAIALIKKAGQSDFERGLDGVNLLRQAWRADGLRGKAGRVAWLEHRFGGRTRRLYGRPRKFAVSHSRFARQGYTPVVADFQAVDDRFYDNTAQTAEMYDRVRVTLPPRPGRPAEYGYESKKTATVIHGGDVATFPYIDIYGPCSKPKVTFANLWAVQVGVTIADGDYVRIDPRPWIRTVTHYKGSSSIPVGDKLTRSSPRLSQMFLPPGYWSASMSFTRTSSPISGPRVVISWRDAHAWW